MLAQHRVKQRAHRVLDDLGRQDPVALRRVVDAVPRPGDALQRAVEVFGLRGQTYLAVRELQHAEAEDEALLEGYKSTGLVTVHQRNGVTQGSAFSENRDSKLLRTGQFCSIFRFFYSQF